MMTDIIAKIPPYVGVLLVFTDIVVAALLWLGVTQTMKRIALSVRTQKTTAILMGSILASWLLVAPTLAAAMSNYLPPLRTGAPNIGTIPLILTPAIAGLWLLRLEAWRQVIDSIPLHWLTAMQFYRIVGAIVFLPLMGMKILPAYFVIPASFGDLIPGLSAPLVAYWIWKRSNHWRSRAIVLNLFGLLDFIVAVGIGSGILYSGLSQILFGEEQIVTAHFAYFPLSLIPLFILPVGIMLHVYSLRRLMSSNLSVELKIGSNAA
jgi:hypothetical protein